LKNQLKKESSSKQVAYPENVRTQVRKSQIFFFSHVPYAEKKEFGSINVNKIADQFWAMH